MRPDWFYSLQGRIPGRPRQVMSVADVLVSHPSEGSRLYAGVVEEFSANRDGEIQDLTRVLAKRWRYLETEPSASPAEPSEVPSAAVAAGGDTSAEARSPAEAAPPKGKRPGMWCDIPGHRLVILGAHIHSINLRYNDVLATDQNSLIRRTLARVIAIARSFMFEDP